MKKKTRNNTSTNVHNTTHVQNSFDTTKLGLIMEHDMGPSKIQNPNMEYVDQAILRCAYTNSLSSQTVLFWFKQTGPKSYYVQYRITCAMTNRDARVYREFPFVQPINDPTNPLYLHEHGQQKMVGENNKYGIRIFHYTHPGRQSTSELVKMAQCLKEQMAMERCSVEVIIHLPSLFPYNGPCVWSNVISDSACYKKIKQMPWIP
jgi:hypothetical protein